MAGDELARPGAPIAPGGVPPDGYDILDTAAAGGAAIRGGVLRTVAFVGGLVVALGTAPLVVRHLGDVDFGRYSKVLAVVAIVTGLTEAGVNTIALRELAAAQERAARDRIMRDLLGLRLVLSVASVVIAVAFSAIAGYGGDLVMGTLLAAIGMLITVMQSLFAAVLQVQLRFALAAAVDFGRQLFTAGMIVLLVYSGAGVVAFLAIIIPAALVALVATGALVRGMTVLRPAFQPRRWLPLLRQTFVFAVAVAVNSLYFRISLVVLSLVANAAQTGYFAVSFRIMEVLVSVPVLLIGAAFPIISRSVTNDPKRFEFVTARLFELGLFTGVLMALCVTLVAPFAIQVIAGSPHHPAADVLRIQSVALIAGFVASASGYPLLSMGRYRETLIANVASLVVVVVATLVLAPGLGAQGAAIAAVAADFTLCVGNVVLLRRRNGPPLPFQSLPVAALAGGAGYLAGTLVGVHPLVQASVGALTFLAVLAAVGRTPPELRELLGGMLPKRA